MFIPNPSQSNMIAISISMGICFPIIDINFAKSYINNHKEMKLALNEKHLQISFIIMDTIVNTLGYYELP